MKDSSHFGLGGSRCSMQKLVVPDIRQKVRTTGTCLLLCDSLWLKSNPSINVVAIVFFTAVNTSMTACYSGASELSLALEPSLTAIICELAEDLHANIS
jgi:hypothetical protein